MRLQKIISTAFAIGVISFGISSCSKDFLEPTIATDKDLETNINDVADLHGVMFGAYEALSQSGFYGRDVIVHATSRSDDGYSNGNSGRFVSSGQFNYQATDGDPLNIWRDGYETIANVNIIINAVTSDDGSAEVDHVKGEAYAVRALAHMELLKYYGQQWTGGTLGIPYITEYLGDLEPARNTIAEVWASIESDLNMARSLMSESLNDGPVRITTYGVAALQSRYYLYVQQWPEAIAAAEYVINSGQFSLADAASYAASFIGSGGNTSVFELAFNSQDNPGINGLHQIYNYTGYGDVVATTDLFNAFEVSDVRQALIEYDVDKSAYRMAGKYPSGSWDDNVRVVRYAEVVLNYAEALFQSGSAAPALTQLNRTATSANATPYASATLDNILLERRKEFSFEGFRFHDLMRNGRSILKVDANQTFSGTEVAPGESRLAFPIPESEMNANSNMVQNTDY